MRPHILIIEDDPSLSQLYNMYLQRAQFETSVVHFAMDAFDILSQHAIDAMLVDINLNEEMNGLDIIAEVRKNPDYDMIKIVTLTSFPERYDETMELGIARSLNKPIKYHELITILKELLGLE